ncbi:MAG: FecR family protein [Prosthecobacter sp.]|nr:FecR family protein [Prosthecobacter sp.]
MKTQKLRAWVVAALMLSCHALRAQTVVEVSRMLVFNEKGTVRKVEKTETANPESGSSGSVAPGKVTKRPKVVAPIGRVSTGVDGASSLILGGTGTARMGAETEVQVPAQRHGNESLELLKGRLFLNISAEELKKQGAGEFLLKTPAALLAVKGTQFFAFSRNGADIIGVMEGSVAVTDRSGKSTVHVRAEQAVTVKGGVISAPRAITDEEMGFKKEFDAAKLVRTTVPVVVEKQHDQRTQKDPPAVVLHRGRIYDLSPPDYLAFKANLAVGTPYLRWHGWEGFVPPFEGNPNAASTRPNTALGEQGARLGTDGILSYIWNWSRNKGSERNEPAAAGALARYALEGKAPATEPFGLLVAIGFRIRCSGIARVEVAVSGTSAVFVPSMTDNAGGWMDCVVQHGTAPSPLPRQTSDFLTLVSFPTGAEDKAKPSKEDTAGVAITDIVLLTLPVVR